MDKERATRFAKRRPVYKAGKDQAKASGLWYEDSLEFTVIPSVQAASLARSLPEIAQVLREAFEKSSVQILKAKVPNFDAARFIADIDRGLAKISGEKQHESQTISNSMHEAPRSELAILSGGALLSGRIAKPRELSVSSPSTISSI